MRVLVTGGCGPAGRSLLDQLDERGVEALGCDLDPLRRADGFRIVPIPAAQDRRFLLALRQLIARERIDVVLPTVSEELPIIAAAGVPEAVIASREAVALAADKWFTTATLRSSAIPVPLSALPRQMDAALAADLGFPFLTKPRIARGGRGVRLHDRWPGARIHDDEIVSEFASGREYCVQVFVADTPRSDVAVVLRKTALRDGLHGNADGVDVEIDPALSALGLAACRALGLTGPADVDIRRLADGTPVVLEVNARFGARSAAAPDVLDAVLRAVRTRLAARAPGVEHAPVAGRVASRAVSG